MQGIWNAVMAHSSGGGGTLCREGYKEIGLWLWSTWVWKERGTMMWVWVMVHREGGVDRGAGKMECGSGANIGRQRGVQGGGNTGT